MARDWRKVALAVLTAATLASVCVLGSRVEAQQTAKSAKAPAKSSAPQAKKDDDDEEQGKAPAKKKRQDPVEAQRAIDAADKLLQGGKAEQAAQALTVTLAGGNLPPAIMARALYIRGTAYRQQSKPAQALKQRAGAYADAGLTESGEIAAAAAPATKEAKERTPTKSWGIVTTPTDNSASNTTKTAEGGSNWFKNWFNSAAPSAQANSAPPVTASIDKTEAPLPKAAQAPAAPRVASAWSSKTQVNAETVPAEVRAPSVPPARAEGKYRIQLAIVRTQQEAAALAAKAKRALAGALAREPEIDQAVLGNMGSFFRVRVGPFATVQETQAVCAKVKGTGFDCLTVTQ
jgi:hypothetical protein